MACMLHLPRSRHDMSHAHLSPYLDSAPLAGHSLESLFHDLVQYMPLPSDSPHMTKTSCGQSNWGCSDSVNQEASEDFSYATSSSSKAEILGGLPQSCLAGGPSHLNFLMKCLCDVLIGALWLIRYHEPWSRSSLRMA